MDDIIDFDDERAEMRDAIEARDSDEIVRIFKDAKRRRDRAKRAGDVVQRMCLERMLGQWLTKLTEDGLLVETH